MIKIKTAGKGTYGTVYVAKTSKKNNTEIAVKRNIIDSEISFSGSIREMDLLNRVRGHPYIVKLLSVSFGNPFIAPNSPIPIRKTFSYREDYLHFVFEKCDKTLHDVIYENEIHVSYLKLSMVQIMTAIEFMHARGVIHRDIKPANLLWFVEKDKTSIKLCDFGLSKIRCFQEPSSPHVVTCWYRAPEISLKKEDYSFKSDIWSIGCVFYEMISRNALLLGMKDDDKKIITKILSILPNLDEEYIKKTIKMKIPIYQNSNSWRSLINLSPKEIKEFNKYPGDGAKYEQFLDLLGKMIEFNPEKRLSATQVLSHEFFKPYQNIIEWSRSNFPPIPKSEPLITIIECKERRWAIKQAFLTFNNRESLEWYSHRKIFQSIDMFDRYLVYLRNLENYELKIESEYSGKFMTKHQTQLRYLVCLYMCIKYFTSLVIPISFNELATDEFKTSRALIEAEEFEQKMLRDVLAFKVYRETIYEAADRKEIKLSEDKIRDVLYEYGIVKSVSSVTPTELLEIFNK